MPPVPELALPPSDFSEEQANDFILAIQILQLLKKADGSRRSIYGLNRAAQRRWPTLGINIELVEPLSDAWAIAGVPSLADMIRAGKEDLGRATSVAFMAGSTMSCARSPSSASTTSERTKK